MRSNSTFHHELYVIETFHQKLYVGRRSNSAYPTSRLQCKHSTSSKEFHLLVPSTEIPSGFVTSRFPCSVLSKIFYNQPKAEACMIQAEFTKFWYIIVTNELIIIDENICSFRNPQAIFGAWICEQWTSLVYICFNSDVKKHETAYVKEKWKEFLKNYPKVCRGWDDRRRSWCPM